MVHYSCERKAVLLKMLLSPVNMSIAGFAHQDNISEATLYNWGKLGGASVPEDNKLTNAEKAQASDQGR